MFDSKNLHHAYIIEGDRERILSVIRKFLEEELRFQIVGNPDFYFREYEKFGVDEARQLVEQQQKKAFGEGRKVFMLAANSVSREAQNSLLKIFEEPTASTHFFLLVPSADRILPTLKSRSVVLKGGGGEPAGFAGRLKSVEKFLNSKPAKRIEIVKGMIADLQDEKITKSDFLTFLNGIEVIKHSDLASIGDLLKMRDYLQDQSSSAKLILEYLALTL